MSRSLCRGPFFLLVPLLLGGLLASLTVWALRPSVGVLAWYWVTLLSVACVVLAAVVIDGLRHLVERRRGNRERRG